MFHFLIQGVLDSDNIVSIEEMLIFKVLDEEWTSKPSHVHKWPADSQGEEVVYWAHVYVLGTVSASRYFIFKIHKICTR